MRTPVYIGMREDKIIVAYSTKGGDTYEFPDDPSSEITLLRDPESALTKIIEHLDDVGIDNPKFIKPEGKIRPLLPEHQILLEKMCGELEEAESAAV